MLDLQIIDGRVWVPADENLPKEHLRQAIVMLLDARDKFEELESEIYMADPDCQLAIKKLAAEAYAGVEGDAAKLQQFLGEDENVGF